MAKRTRANPEDSGASWLPCLASPHSAKAAGRQAPRLPAVPRNQPRFASIADGPADQLLPELRIHAD
jgi:hypothetical protein